MFTSFQHIITNTHRHTQPQNRMPSPANHQRWHKRINNIGKHGKLPATPD